MKMSRKWILVAALVLSVAMASSGTIAYLQDSDSDVNVMTMGSVYIEQIEQERDASGNNLVDFSQGKPALPAVGPIKWAAEGVDVNGTKYKVFTEELKNVVDKIVTVKNTGKSDAFVRTIVAIEAPDYDPNDLIHVNYNADPVLNYESFTPVEIDGVKYVYAVFTYVDALEPNEISAPSLMQLFLDSAADNKDCAKFGDTWEVLVLSQAVQADGFDNAKNALDTAFGVVDENNVKKWFDEDVEVPTSFTVKDDAELAALLAEIKANEELHDTAITVYLASGTYSGDHVINQYPHWNGIAGDGKTENNMAALKPGEEATQITFIGVGDVEFTGNVTVKGFGNSNNGFVNATKTYTTFQNVTFDAATSADNEEDSIAMYVTAAANNVSFVGCTFENATHVTLGGSNPNGVGKVDFVDCTFNDGGCLSGKVKNLTVIDCKIDGAKNGFINMAGDCNIKVEKCDIRAGKYFLRTNDSGLVMNVKNCTIEMYESEGAKDLVKFRGSNESATFTGCTIANGYTTAGVDANSILTIE